MKPQQYFVLKPWTIGNELKQVGDPVYIEKRSVAVRLIEDGVIGKHKPDDSDPKPLVLEHEPDDSDEDGDAEEGADSDPEDE